jgi:hypothetical protein
MPPKLPDLKTPNIPDALQLGKFVRPVPLSQLEAVRATGWTVSIQIEQWYGSEWVALRVSLSNEERVGWMHVGGTVLFLAEGNWPSLPT